MAKAMEDRMVLPIILRLYTAMLVVYACLRSGNETFCKTSMVLYALYVTIV